MQLMRNNPSSIIPSATPFIPPRGDKRGAAKQTATPISITTKARTMPSHSAIQPPAILPNIAVAPMANIIYSSFTMPEENISDTDERPITNNINPSIAAKTSHNPNGLPSSPKGEVGRGLSDSRLLTPDSSPPFTTPTDSRQMSSRNTNANGQEKNNPPMANPNAPVETNTPNARMSLPVVTAVCLPPHTWKSEFPIPRNEAALNITSSLVEAEEATKTREATSTPTASNTSPMSNIQCFQCIASAHKPVSG